MVGDSFVQLFDSFDSSYIKKTEGLELGAVDKLLVGIFVG